MGNGGFFDEPTHSLRADVFDASEDGTARGTPLVPTTYAADDYANMTFEQTDVARPLTNSTDRTRSAPIVAFSAKDHGADATEEVSPTLRAGGHTESHANAGVMPAIAFNLRGRDGGAMPECDEIASVRAATGGSSRSYVATGEDYGNAYEADAGSVLSTLRRKVGEETATEWGHRVLASLQSPEVLQSWLHGTSLRLTSESFRHWVDDRPLPREEGSAAETLRKVWQEGPDGCSPQGRGLSKQLFHQFREAVSKLSHERTQAEKEMLNLWESSQGLRVLQQALFAVQSRQASLMAVRRLTPAECEKLQGMEPDYTLVPFRGKPAADGPRYKAIGNSWAVPVLVWIGQRVIAVEAEKGSQ